MKKAKIVIKLKSPEGMNSETTAEITPEQWADINLVIEGKLSSEEVSRMQDRLISYDALSDEIGEFYDEESPKYNTGDLCDMGEIVATHFGWF